MADPEYEVFDLLVERSAPGYRARVVSSPAGEDTAELQEPISEERFNSFLFKVGRPRQLSRGTSVGEETKKFGRDLFNFLFPGKILTCLERSKFAADARGRGLRIQIRLSDVPELCDLPWEFLYQDDASFIALSSQTPIVRFLEIRQPLSPLEVQHPLRILVVISSPRDLAPLNVAREWDKLREAVSDIEAKGLVQLERLDAPRLSELNRRLRTKQFHIVHFIGHGSFDERRSIGQLFFEDDQKQWVSITADQLATVLRDHRSVRLVILNACEGARSSRTDPFSGTAQSLIRAGTPAVIAMQFEVTDDAAITFASELYASIAVGDSIDRSLSEARKAIYSDGNELEWATPVLYLRSPNSRIFAIAQTSVVEEQRATLDAMHRAAAAAQHVDGTLCVDQATPQAEDKREAEEAARLAEEKPTPDEAARLAEDKRRAEEAAEEKHKAVEAARLERKADEAARRAEKKRKAVEAARLAEEKRKADEAARQAEEKRKSEEAEAARLAEEKRKVAAAEAARLAEEQRQSEEKRQAEEAEAARRAEEKRKVEEAEAARRAEEQRQQEHERRWHEDRKRAEERQRLEEETREKVRRTQATRQEQEQEAGRRREEALRLAKQKREAEEEQRKAEEAARQAKEKRRAEEAEAARLAEEKRLAGAAEDLRLKERRTGEEATRQSEEERKTEEAGAARLAEEGGNQGYVVRLAEAAEAGRLAEEKRLAGAAEEKRQANEASRRGGDSPSPSYPAEHAVASGTAVTVLSYLFPEYVSYFKARRAEQKRRAEEAGAARLAEEGGNQGYVVRLAEAAEAARMAEEKRKALQAGRPAEERGYAVDAAGKAEKETNEQDLQGDNIDRIVRWLRRRRPPRG